MAAEFSSCVEYGVQLSKRIYYGKELRSMPAGEPQEMTRSPDDYLPSAPMVYAVVPEPAIVDNPDVPSYQPYVHGRCVPPALVPLHMNEIAMVIDSHFDTAFVAVTGAWRVHCIMAGKRCDCRIAIPMGEMGSLLGVEVEVCGRSYRAQLVTKEDVESMEKVPKAQNGRLLKGQIYTFNVPKVDGGSFLNIKINWSQKLTYDDGQFCLKIPFSFPSYVNPVGKKVSKREKILLNVNSGTGAELLCKSTSHPVKVVKRQVGKISFSYEADVLVWSSANFKFSYALSSSDLFGGVFLQSPFLRDFDEREIFCLYLFPGNNQTRKVFRKEVIYVIDTSGSMRGGALENVKNALLASLYKLNSQDTFNIITFNGDVQLFSPSMELATKETILKATQWASTSFDADGGTNILLPLEKAIKLLAESDSIPFIFLITDGTVEDEREICNFMKGHLTNGSAICPRICTFGIGLYCNHYFLQMLAQIGKGYYDAAYDLDSIDSRMQQFFNRTSSVLLANITFNNNLEHLDSLELFPSSIPDLSSGNPLIVSGRFDGKFPDIVKVSGTLADMSNFTVDLKVQKAKEVPLYRVLARRQIDILTSQAWLTGSRELEEKVAKISKQTGVPSEYTPMILVQTDYGKKAPDPVAKQEVQNKLNLWKKGEPERVIILGSLGIEFGNLKATTANTSSVIEEIKPTEPTEILVKAASNCCSRLLNRFCCMCFIQSCSKMNDQCAIILAQICTALACCECLNCCYELCS